MKRVLTKIPLRRLAAAALCFVFVVSTLGIMPLIPKLTPAYASTPPALDNSAYTWGHDQPNNSIVIATSAANEILLVDFYGSGQNTKVLSSFTDNDSLTWASRQNATSPDSNTMIYRYWALVPTVTTVNVTAFWAISGDYEGILAETISGASTSSPFDGSPVNATGSGANPSTTITTTQTNDFLVCALGGTSGHSVTVGTGWTLTHTSGSYFTLGTEYQTAATATTYTANWTDTAESWAMIVDAVQPPAAHDYATYVTSGMGASINLMDGLRTGRASPS